jgi:hypothetical protein
VKSYLPLLFVGAAFLGGCARVSVNTDLSADGSFTRTVKYTVSNNGMEGATKPEDMFAVPAASGDLKIVPTADSDGSAVEVSRKVALNAGPLQDITLLSDDKKPLVVSAVSVRKLDDGKLEYSESLKWVGPIPKDQTYNEEEARNLVKQALPARYQMTATIDRVTHRVLVTVIHVLFGPSDPVAFAMVGNPDMVNHKAQMLLVPPLSSALKIELPDLTDEETLATARTLTKVIEQVSDKAKAASTPPAPGSDAKKNSNVNEMTPLTFAVSYPGKLVETNGLQDPYQNQVYWSLYPVVLPLEDVHLRLVVQP